MPEFVISPSELDTMRQCPLKHQIMYRERWTKPIDKESHPLAFGTLWHSMLEAHYLTIQSFQRQAHREHGDWTKFDHKATLERAMDQVSTVIASEVSDEEVEELLIWMYGGYVRAYGVDPEWQIVAVEHPGEVDLPGPPGFDAEITFRIKFKIDLIVKWQGRLWIVDNKSCKNLPNRLELDLDDQFGLYHWAGRKMGHNIFGTMHSAARKTRLKTREAPLDERFRRTPLTRGSNELDRIALEAWQEAYERYTGGQRIIEMRRAGIDVDAQRRPNPNSCGWRCDITEPCIASRKGVSLRDYLKRKGYKVDHSRH